MEAVGSGLASASGDLDIAHLNGGGQAVDGLLQQEAQFGPAAGLRHLQGLKAAFQPGSPFL